ncbi:MAG: hypothetical protein NT027_00940 [Proteobacteria bacterium]|nr:hypothetical protein [Pseudomonadota bacterium]
MFSFAKTSTSSKKKKKSDSPTGDSSGISEDARLFHNELLLAQGVFRFSMANGHGIECRVKIEASEKEITKSTTYSVAFSGKAPCINSQYTTLSNLYSCRADGFRRGEAVKCVGMKDEKGNKVQIGSERGLANPHLEIEAPNTVRFSIHRIEGERN